MDFQLEQWQREQQQSEQYKRSSLCGPLSLEDKLVRGLWLNTTVPFFLKVILLLGCVRNTIGSGVSVDFSEILKAYKKGAKGKRKSLDCARFESRLGAELLSLMKDINDRTYAPGQSRCFVITKPKAREIWAAPFRDRVVHHLIVEHIEAIYEKSFSNRSFACRKGKGLHAVIKDLQKQVRQISKGGRQVVWALKVDIESFFVTIDRDILKGLILAKVCDPEIIFLIESVFQHDPRANFKKCGWRGNFKLIPIEKSWLSKPRQTGIPIGNLTSQFGANLYLNGLDHYIERQLKPKGYLRYMDDLLILSDSKESLLGIDEKINSWLQVERHQSLNPKKTVLVPLTAGMDYLGLFIKQVYEPKEPLVVFPSKKKKWDLVKSLNALKLQKWFQVDLLHELAFPSSVRNRTVLQGINSRLGLLKVTKNYKFRELSIKRYLNEAQHDERLSVSQDFGKMSYLG